MRSVARLLARVVRDERGGEVLEYALVAGLIIITAVAVIAQVGAKVLARWEAGGGSR
jgi:Flp pilus assembly pilin Flp